MLRLQYTCNQHAAVDLLIQLFITYKCDLGYKSINDFIGSATLEKHLQEMPRKSATSDLGVEILHANVAPSIRLKSFRVALWFM